MSLRDIIPYENEDSSLGMEDCRWKEVHAKSLVADEVLGGVKHYIDTNVASSPNYFARNTPLSASGKLTIKTPDSLWVNINNKGHKANTATTLDVTDPMAWDSKATTWTATTKHVVGDYVYTSSTTDTYIYKCVTAGTTNSSIPSFPTTVGANSTDGTVKWECCLNYSNANNRAGRDFFVYALYSDDGVPSYILSVNSTVPHGYTADTTRKIGGFHCLCADVGTITSHKLSAYAKGNIIPTSVWDLRHKPKTDIGGMVYDEGTDIWVSIYLMSWTGTAKAGDLKLYSKYGAVAGDGASSEKFHCLKWEQWLANQQMRLPTWSEFVHLSLGSNQGTNVAGTADVNTTGGFKDTAGRRMISHIGAEDCCGVLWQWGADMGSATTTEGTWASGYTDDDAQVAGQIYGSVYRPLFGGAADSGAGCGSRGCGVDGSALYLGWFRGCRAVSEPLLSSKGISF